METALKVGALAKQTGLTVRTLHHYDEIGLLSPSQRTASGHRLYGEEELRRLHQIASLKQLGLPLDEIRECLTRAEYSLEYVLDLQIERIDERIERERRLRTMLEGLRKRLRSGIDTSIDELARAVEVTVSFDKYYTSEQQAELAQRRERVGEERMRAAQREWEDVFAGFTSAMERGLDPSHPEVQALAEKSAALIEEFTAGDPGIEESLRTMFEEEGTETMASRHGMPGDTALWEYMAEARVVREGE